MNHIFKALIVSLVLLAACQPDELPQQSLTELLPELETVADTLLIDSNKDTLLTGNAGTKIFIPANAFQTLDGEPVTGEVEIHLEEYYDLNKSLAEGLTTMAGDRMLRTGGMLHIAALADSQEVMLKAGKELVLHFPKQSDRNLQMQLFAGERDSLGNMNWIVDSATILKPSCTMKTWSMGSKYTGYYITGQVVFKDQSLGSLEDYFEKHFDLNKIGDPASMVGHILETRMQIEQNGKVTAAHTYDQTNYWTTRNDAESEKNQVEIPSNYVNEFMLNLPAIMPSEFPWTKDGWTDGNGRRGNAQVWISIDYEKPEFLSNEAYVDALERTYASQGKDLLEERGGEAYIFAYNKLGWINCDAFWDIPQERIITQQVEVGENFEGQAYLVFENMNSILPGQLEAGVFEFANVPNGKKAKLVCLGSVAGAQKMAVNEIYLDGEKPIDLKLKPLEKEALKTALQTLSDNSESQSDTIPTEV